MKESLRALARFDLDAMAAVLGAQQPALEYALRAALSDTDDGQVARELETLVRTNRRSLAAHADLLAAARAVLAGQRIAPDQRRVLALFGLHSLRTMGRRPPWGPLLRDGPLSAAIAEAYSAMRAGEDAAVVRLLGRVDDRAAPALAPILAAIAETFGGAGRLEARKAGKRTAIRALPLPEGFDLDRGRESRADLVAALLRAKRVWLADPETGRVRGLIVAELIDLLLRDPFWDDIDASVEQDGVVPHLLAGAPSPAIDGRRVGQPSLYIRRIET